MYLKVLPESASLLQIAIRVRIDPGSMLLGCARELYFLEFARFLASTLTRNSHEGVRHLLLVLRLCHTLLEVFIFEEIRVILF